MDWQPWRDEFPITGDRVHLNHAGVSPISRRVAEAIKQFTDEALHLSPSLYKGWEVRCEEIRCSFATLIGAKADEIAFVKNTSEGISLIAHGLDWRSGDNVIALDGEYPSNVYPWWSLRRLGVETRMVSCERGSFSLDSVAALADARTRLLAVSFVDWSHGTRTDLRRLGEFCRARDILLCVDGIQGVGALRLDVEAMHIDCLAVGGHKWLLAPEGCGALFVSRRVIDRFHSVLHGWKSVTDAERYMPYHFDPRPDALQFEPGSPPQLATHAFGAAVDLLLEVGPSNIESRILHLTGVLAEQLRRLGSEIISPWEESQRSAIVVFRLGQDVQALADELNRKGFVVRCRGGGIRVAPHFYNNEDDIERFIAALRLCL